MPDEVARQLAEEKEKAEQKAVSDKIISLLEELKTKIDDQNTLLRKIASLVNQLYQNNEINKDTFNKLDEFLKPYYDNPYNDGKF